jgi:hypothetical protein
MVTNEYSHILAIDMSANTCLNDVGTTRFLVKEEIARNRPKLIFVLLFGFYFLILSISISRGTGALLGDPDVYWHVAVGRDIWRTATLPHFDEYSHTFRGHPWIAKEWLSQLLLYGAYALAGWRGVATLAAGVVALTYGLLFLALACQMRAAVALGVATLAWAFSMGHFIARPQIFADPLIVIWVAGLANAIERRKPPSFWLLPVMTLWANLHGSFTIGLAIAAGLALEAIFHGPPSARAETARHWATFLIAALTCAGLTPYGYQPLLMTFQVFYGNEALQYVWEWRPRTLEAMGVNELTLYGLLFLALYCGVKLPPLRLAALLCLIYLMLAHLRFAALFAISAPLLLAAPLTRQYPSLRRWPEGARGSGFSEAMARGSRRLFYPMGGLTALGVLAFFSFGANVAPKAEISPEGAVNFIFRERLTGNIFNDYNFGGYLIFRGLLTFIDGRSDQLFVGGFLVRLRDAIEKHPKDLESYLDTYNISNVLVVPDSLVAEELAHSPHWESVYVDGISKILQKRKF